MSSENDALPPADAPFPERLRAAMAASEYRTQRRLAAALQTDGSLVGKWLTGSVSPSPRYRQALQDLLPVPEGYFSETARIGRLEELAADVGRLLLAVADIETRLGRLERQRARTRAGSKRPAEGRG